jgi:multiple sugar transport system ATP-binding protein
VETQDGIRWPVLREAAAGDGLDVSYGVRPEHLAVVECGSAGSVPGEVVVVEPTGAETELLVRCGASDITVVTHGRVSINPGDQIGLGVAPGAVHLFDQISGSRIPDVEGM